MFRTTVFDRLLDRATSHLRLEPDWTVILQICDMIRQGDVQPKVALAALKKKLASPNPHIMLYALLVIESCVKNCGSPIHDEIATKAFMEYLKELLNGSQKDEVRNKILELIQAWAHAFRNSPKYRAVPDFVNIMKAEGYSFPVLNESDAMFSADTAPEWLDGDVCHRCRVAFSMMQRKHHCRACGQVFCAQCSSKSMPLPKFGIEKEVRVCDDCHEKFSKSSNTVKSSSKTEELLPAEYLNSPLAKQSQTPAVKATGKTEDELKEEEELQLALALSQSEAESSKPKVWSTSSASIMKQEPPSYSPPTISHEDTNPELAKYLNRSYWEQKKDESILSSGNRRSPTASAPIITSLQQTMQQDFGYDDKHHYNGSGSVGTGSLISPDETDSELDNFIRALKSQVEIFVNRMKSNSSRGRSIANDSSVQTLFVNITTMHSRLLKYIQQQDDKRVYFEGLQDKLTQVKDARAALDALREEHSEKLRREAEMAERQKQIQMAHKLDVMRKKKQDYLQYQRTLALQKIQEQEYEMQRRQEQQKQQYMMHAGFHDPARSSQMYPAAFQQPYNPPTQTPHNIIPPRPELGQSMLPSQPHPGQQQQQAWNPQSDNKPLLNQMIPSQIGQSGILAGQQTNPMVPINHQGGPPSTQIGQIPIQINPGVGGQGNQPIGQMHQPISGSQPMGNPPQQQANQQPPQQIVQQPPQQQPPVKPDTEELISFD